MEPGRFAFILTFIIYAIFFDWRILFIFGTILVGIALFHMLTPRGFNSTRRKLQISSWDEPREGVILAKYQANTTKLQEFIKDYREKKNVRITLLHFFIKVMADILKECPDINGKVVLGKYISYDQVNISCLVDIDGGKDLAVALIEDADKKNIEEIATYLNSKATKIKSHEDDLHKKQTSTFKLLPSFLIGFVLEIVQILGVDIGLNIPAVGLKHAPFGGVMITNIGALGVQDAYAPFTPFTRVPIVVTLCATTKRPVVKDDKIEIASITDINLTIDHRFMDGGRIKKVIGKLDDYFEHPEQFATSKKSD